MSHPRRPPPGPPPSRATTRHWINAGAGARFRPARSLPLGDRGFRYGMAVFETIRIHEGRPLFLDEHVARLREACRESSFPVAPERLDGAAGFLRETLGAGVAFTAAHGVARIHVTAGDGAMLDPPRDCRVLVSLEPRCPPCAEAYARGLRLVRHPAPHHPIFQGRKTHNYWANLAALALAKGRGADEALLYDASDRLISACLGNVFSVQGGRLCTPPLGGGARAGVVRTWVMTNFGPRESDPVHTADDTQLYIYTNSWWGPVIASITDIKHCLHTDVIFARKVMDTYSLQCRSQPGPGSPLIPVGHQR